MSRWFAERAWLGGGRGVRGGVVVDVEGERITAVDDGVQVPPPDAVRLSGLLLPGFANTHTHAFHRALRGRAQGAGDFWAWRELMYGLANRLEPDTYYALARASYAEMALAGITRVGEFHYLHHPPGGGRYAEPDAMGTALVQAAADAGIGLTLLDACYLQADVDGGELAGPQRRFGDAGVDEWWERLQASRAPRAAAAIHSVRSVPPAAMAAVADRARARDLPLHLHLSEQPRENEACRAVYGVTPTRLCADNGILGPQTTAVHATHVTGWDVEMLGRAEVGVCLCPTTERDLADGVGPARRLADAGVPLSVGTDSNAVIDVFEEARAVELDQRLVTGHRGLHRPEDLLRAATRGGMQALGWPDAGELRPGWRADFVAVGLDSCRLAGARDGDDGDLLTAVTYAATSEDITHVVVDGRPVVVDGRHLTVEDPARALADAVSAATPG